MKRKAATEDRSTREKILSVAIREFSSHGFSGARMDRIASLAKCNIRMLYHYFGSKEGLYVHVIEELFDKFRLDEEMVEVDLDDPVGSIENFFRFMCDFFARNLYIDGIIRNENLMEGKYINQVDFSRTRKWLNTTLFALVAAGKFKNVVRQDLDHLDLYLTITALSRYHISNRYTLSAVMGVEIGSEAWQQRRLSEGLAIVRAYIAPRPDGSAAPAIAS